MRLGGSVADVWVMSDSPAAPETMLFDRESFRRADTGALPSRAADNLYWLGRYIERAEGAIRFCAPITRLPETGERFRREPAWKWLLLGALYIDVAEPGIPTIEQMLAARVNAPIRFATGFRSMPGRR
jgi:hypothetical protein